jgi:hypothetical protein
MFLEFSDGMLSLFDIMSKGFKWEKETGPNDSDLSTTACPGVAKHRRNHGAV